MAFSARASSSIPGVFPPLKLGETLDQFNRMTPPGRQIAGVAPSAPRRDCGRPPLPQLSAPGAEPEGDLRPRHLFRRRRRARQSSLRPAIAEVLRRPNDQEVKRFLLYLQPDPGKPPAAPNGKKPGLLGTIWKGLSGVPSQQPILNDLNAVAAYNENVRRIHDIVRAEEVATQALERKGGASPDCAKPESLTVAQRFGCAAGILGG